jgi:hypothetical protein
MVFRHLDANGSNKDESLIFAELRAAEFTDSDSGSDSDVESTLWRMLSWPFPLLFY